MRELEDLASRLNVLTARLSDHTRLEDRFMRLTTSTSRLDALARRLERTTDFLGVAREDGLPGADEVSKTALSSVAQLIGEARTAITPVASTEPDPLPLDRLDTELEPFVQSLEAVARRVWREYASSIVIQGEVGLLSALARIPGLQTQVESIRGLQDRIGGMLTLDLPTSAQYQQLSAAADQHRAEWSSLPISDSPDVINFLRRAAERGASLAELDRARAWLDEKNLALEFVVRPATPTR